MKKIPVGATIAHAYRFGFGQFLNLLKLLWLPLLLTLGLNALVGPQMNALTQRVAADAPFGITLPAPLVILLTAVAWIFSLMVVTGIFQFALGKDEAVGRGWYFSFAMPLWRLIGAFLLMILAMIALLAVYVLAVIIVLFLFRLGLVAAHVSDTALRGIMAFDTVLAFLAGYCGFVFCWIRFGFLLGATTIAEDRIGLFQSWTLSHRNFWRMFAVTLAVFLPFVVIEMGLFYQMGLFPHLTPGLSAAQMQAMQRATTQAMFARIEHYWYLVYPAGLVFTLVLYGLMAGASAFAYRALSEEAKSI